MWKQTRKDSSANNIRINCSLLNNFARRHLALDPIVCVFKHCISSGNAPCNRAHPHHQLHQSTMHRSPFYAWQHNHLITKCPEILVQLRTTLVKKCVTSFPTVAKRSQRYLPNECCFHVMTEYGSAATLQSFVNASNLQPYATGKPTSEQICR